MQTNYSNYGTIHSRIVCSVSVYAQRRPRFILLFDFHKTNITLHHSSTCWFLHMHKPLASITSNVFKLMSKASLPREKNKQKENQLNLVYKANPPPALYNLTDAALYCQHLYIMGSWVQWSQMWFQRLLFNSV